MSTPDLIIRPYTTADMPAVWPILEETIRRGDTYAIAPDLPQAEVMRLWCEVPRAVFVAEREGRVLGTYYIKTNQHGGGSHVCNCGYITASEARGLGVARAMCEQSQTVAREIGYLAMQFNFVVATNRGAIDLWSRLGFDIVGRLPLAFRHPDEGLVDALVMYKSLESAPV